MMITDATLNLIISVCTIHGGSLDSLYIQNLQRKCTAEYVKCISDTSSFTTPDIVSFCFKTLEPKK